MLDKSSFGARNGPGKQTCNGCPWYYGEHTDRMALWFRWFTAVMFLLNNTFIQGFHVLTGAKYLNTMTGGNVCTIGFSAIAAVISWLCSLPRTFETLSKLAAASAFFTFVSVILATIFAGIEDHPGAGWPSKGAPTVYAFPPPGTTFVAGVNAFMNISYTFIVRAVEFLRLVLC